MFIKPTEGPKLPVEKPKSTAAKANSENFSQVVESLLDDAVEFTSNDQERQEKRPPSSPLSAAIEKETILKEDEEADLAQKGKRKGVNLTA